LGPELARVGGPGRSYSRGVVAHELAQMNIGRLVAPLDTPTLAGFVAGLEPINALADAAPGFVWRLQTEEGDATSLRPWDDDTLLVNMSTWTSAEALYEYVYRTVHRDFLRRRREWFEHMGTPITVLWWVPAGHRPTPAEGKERLDLLTASGPTPEAFTFRTQFPAPQPAPG